MPQKGNVRYKDAYKKKAPSRADHLKPHQWKPGESGNKTGRPRGAISITEQLKMYLRRHPEELEKIVVSLVKQGILGNIIATKEMFDRVDGKVADRHKLEGDMPIQLIFAPAQQISPSAEQGEGEELTCEKVPILLETTKSA